MNSQKNLNKLEKILEINFADQSLLKQALIHRSYLNEIKTADLKSNERLEFLGDAVLELWTTKELFNNFPNLSEGVLTNVRAAVVCTTSLAEEAEKIGLGSYLLLSKGEEKTGGRNNPSLLADTLEAVIGAVYLDQGWQGASEFLNQILGDKLMQLGREGDIKDAKTLFQEMVQEKLKITPRYEVLNETGPDHNKLFTAGVFLNGRQITNGKGKSKRLAEESAAQSALTKLTKTGKI